MGLDAGGLVRIRERQFQVVGLGDGTSATPAKSVCQDSHDTIWIGTLGKGLIRWGEGIVTNIDVPEGAGKGFVFSTCPDTEGRLWLSADNENLYVYQTNSLRLMLPLVHGVKTILAGKTGRIWVGTHSGLYFADHPEVTKSNQFKLFPGTGSQNVRVLAEDSRGQLWVGCNDGGLLCVAGGSTTEFRPTDEKNSQPIWSLLPEDDGSLWIGTFRGGLLRFRDGKFTRYDLAEGLPDNIICQILPDDAGHLWLGTHQGIFRVAKSALNEFADGESNAIPVTIFGRSDGLPSLDCSGGYQPAACRAQDGQLWFTTVKGAVSVQPEKIRPNRRPPEVIIEELFVDGKGFDLTVRNTEQLQAGVVYSPKRKRFIAPPGKHQFEIRYTGLSLVASDRVQFRYRLENVDDGWISVGTKRNVEYNLLSAGTYRFHVIACNSDGYWNTAGDTVTLEIRPHLYESLWFRILVGLMSASLIAASVWYAVARRLHRRLEVAARQQALERERARIAKDIHDDLGASLTLITRLGHLARREKTAERVEKMESTAREAVRSLDEIVWAVNPRNDTLAHLIDYTGQFATDYLYAAGLRCLLDVPDQVVPIEVPSNVRHNIFLTIKEALQNIVKHAKATEVGLRIHGSNSSLRIVIDDNGCGFEPPPEDALADGLRNMRQRMDEIGGQCQVLSRAGQGTPGHH